MKIGIVGAGKMGYTLGKHFSVNKSDELELVGYYSKNKESAMDAAKFTDSNYFITINELLNKSDLLFLTVPDGEIVNVIDLINENPHMADDKIICHTSGALSSSAMNNIKSNAFLYSVHPIYAVNSKKEAYFSFSEAFITIEGDVEHIDDIKLLFTSLGHSVKIISSENKVKYHSAAVFSSNFVVGLYHMAEALMKQCGFCGEEINQALKPLFINNAKKLYDSNCEAALTGPIERCDINTVIKHLDVLDDEYYEVYKLISKELVKIATDKNKDKDYSILLDYLSD